MAEFTPISADAIDLTWPADLDHFSANSAKMAVRCPEQWRRRYVLGQKSPPALAALAGRADHRAIEVSMAQKIKSYVDLPVSDVRGVYVDILEKEVAESGGLSEIEIRNAETTTARIDAFDDARTIGADLVECYQRTASPFVQPIAVEQEITIPLPSLPVKVIGYIDLIATDTDEFVSDRIIDRKGRARYTSKIEPEWQIQADIYQLAVPLPHEWHISVRTKTPQVIFGHEDLILQPRDPQIAIKQLEQIVAQIGFYYQRYGPDEPWPAGGKLHPWACSYCAWKGDCWAWA